MTHPAWLSSILLDTLLKSTILLVSAISSDYEKSRVLQSVARRYPLQGALRESYIKAANSISSEYERDRALAALAHRATL